MNCELFDFMRFLYFFLLFCTLFFGVLLGPGHSLAGAFLENFDEGEWPTSSSQSQSQSQSQSPSSPLVPVPSVATPKSSTKSSTKSESVLDPLHVLGPLKQSQTWLLNQWKKATVSLPLGANFSYSTDWGADSSGNHSKVGTGVSVRAKWTVEPAFVKNYQLRTDDYLLKFNLGGQYQKLGLSYQSYVQLTFARPFAESKSMQFLKEKESAILQWPLFVQDIPWTVSQITSEDFPVGSSMRIELGNASFMGVGNSTATQLQGFLNLSVSKKIRWVVDLYKISNQKVRIRVMSFHNRADLSAEAKLRWIPLQGAVNYAMDWVVDKAVGGNCYLFRLEGSKNLLEKFPVENWMADYELRFPEANSAYEEFFSSLFQSFYHTEVLQLLNPFPSEELMTNLFSRRIAVFEKYRAFSDHQVHRWFRAQSQSTFSTQFFGSQCGNLWEATTGDQNAQHLIREWDDSNRMQYFVYNTQNSKGKSDWLFRIWSERDEYSFATVYGAESSDGSIQNVKPKALVDLKWVHEMKDKDFSISEGQGYFSNLEYLVPDMKNISSYRFLKDSFSNNNPSKSSRFKFINTFLRFELGLNQRGMAQVEQHLMEGPSSKRLQDLSDFIDHYPGKSLLPREGGLEAWQATSFDEEWLAVSRELTQLIEESFDLGTSNSSWTRTTKFNELKKKNIFKQLGMGYFVHQMSSDQRRGLLNISLKGSSASISRIPVVISRAYSQPALMKSMEYMMRVWNNQDFDWVLQRDALQENDNQNY